MINIYNKISTMYLFIDMQGDQIHRKRSKACEKIDDLFEVVDIVGIHNCLGVKYAKQHLLNQINPFCNS